MKIVQILAAALSVVIISACGGGGGGGGSTATTTAPVTYVAAATVGELVSYTVDPSALTYSYTITESQYGLTGQTGSGTLTSLGNNGYSLSGIPNSRIQILPNGIMLGAIRHNFGAGVTTVPVMGLANPVSTFTGVAGTYNYISRNCVSGVCVSNYGTLVINSVGTWSYCASGNSSGCTATGSGNLTALGGGKFTVDDGGITVGTMVAMASSVSGQNVVIIDLKDARTSAPTLGKGIVVASSQVAINSALTNGSWYVVGSNGSYGTFNLTGGTASYTSVNGVASSGISTVTLENPWTGMGSNVNGKGLLAGYGVYLFTAASGYIEIGMKYN
jgi:hypothetical protein